VENPLFTANKQNENQRSIKYSLRLKTVMELIIRLWPGHRDSQIRCELENKYIQCLSVSSYCYTITILCLCLPFICLRAELSSLCIIGEVFLSFCCIHIELLLEERNRWFLTALYFYVCRKSVVPVFLRKRMTFIIACPTFLLCDPTYGPFSERMKPLCNLQQICFS
jgi:hypothetical protein